jgi:molecular chaperone DnaJ
MGERIAVLIGSGRFRDRALPALKTPAADVRDLARVLCSPGLTRFEPVIELIDATADQARREIARVFSKRRRDDLVLLYYSGHGLKDDSGQLHLTMEDTEQELLSATGISADFVSEQMDRSFSRRQILILDCCFSGAFVTGAKGSVGDAAQLAQAFQTAALQDRALRAAPCDGYGRVIITACDAVSYAMENLFVVTMKPSTCMTRV